MSSDLSSAGNAEAAASPAAAAAPAEESEAAGQGLTSLLEALRQPLSEAQPCGEKVTYDEDFLRLKAQINRIESATAAVDYEQVVERGRRILTEKSKDLTTACYLALGLTRRQGTAGLAAGLAGTHLLVRTYWEGLYPAVRRMAGRRNALQFLADRLRDWLARYKDPAEADREPLVQARDDLSALQAFCMEAMGGHAPAFSGLQAALGNVIDRLPDPASEQEASEQEASEEEAEETASGEARPAASGKIQGKIQSTSEARQTLTRGIAFLRARGTSNPVPYRLMRALRWGVLQDELPHENGRTRIAPPLEQRRTYLTGLAERGDYETLVEEGEASFQDAPFHLWLDLQRLLAGALDALGAPYAPVRDAILAETTLLVRRLPRLPALAFSDGTPFAGPLTREWIERRVEAVLGDEQKARAPAGSSPADSEDARLKDQYDAARQQLGAGTLQGALAAMQEGRAQEASPQARFRRRLYMADLCLTGDRPAVARPVLEGLAAEVQQHALGAWDPALALKVWSRLHACYKALGRSASQPEQQALRESAQEAFENICRLDAAYALSMDP